MPRKKQAESKDSVDVRLKAWRTRVKDAMTLHDDWESTFRCRELHAKYVGTGQWLEQEDPDGTKYSVNLFYSGVETRKPSLIFATPRFRVKPSPAMSDDEFTPSEFRAKLLQDTINTISSDPRVKILPSSLLALHEAFFRFGVVEIGLKTDVVDNPRAGRPILLDDEEKIMLLDSGGKPVIEPPRVPIKEQPYVRNIPASSVLISISNKNDTDENDWIGYWEWVAIEDIQANKHYDEKAKKTVKAGSGRDDDKDKDFSRPSAEFPDEYRQVRVFKTWDLRGKRKRVFADTGDTFLLDEKYTILPLLLLRFHQILNSWYPLPPTFNWLPQQREANDVREMLRRHRKRFIRKYSVIDGMMDESAMDDLESDEDGIYVRVPKHEVIEPIKDAPLDNSVRWAIPATMEDFMLVSGVTGEQKGVSEADTATQANIINTHSRMRDGFSRETVATFVSVIATRMLQLIADTASLDFWIRTNVDKTSQGAQKETEEIQMAWRIMKANDLSLAETLNYEVTVDMDSLSPQTEAETRQAWDSALQLMTNPPVALHMLASDVILRKVLSLRGIKAEREIQEIKRAMMKVQTFMLQQQALGQAGILPILDSSDSGKPSPTGMPRPQQLTQGNGPGSGSGGQPSQPGQGSQAAPNNNQIAGQIMSQLGGGQ